MRSLTLRLVAISAGVALTGCTLGSTDPQEPLSVVQESLSDAEYATLLEEIEPSRTDFCDHAWIRCGTAGPRDVAFAVVELAGGSATSDGHEVDPLILVDPGGPGMSFRHSLEAVTTIAGESSHTFLVIAEPWTRIDIGVECLRELRASLEGGTTGGWPTSCPTSVWWEPGEYEETVADIEQQLGTNVGLVLAVSFGSLTTRPLYLAREALPVLLVRPAPPPSTMLEAVLDYRARTVPSSIAERHPGVEVVLAVVGASYSREDYHALIEKLESASVLDEDLAAEIERRAMAATYRFGAGDVMPNLIGYLAGMCGAFPRGATAGLANPVVALLNSVHPCPDRAPGSAEEKVDGMGANDRRVARTCIVVDEYDLVSPIDVTEHWEELMSPADVSWARSGEHGEVPAVIEDLVDAWPSWQGCGHLTGVESDGS